MPQRKCSGAGPNGRGAEHSDKLCAREAFGHPAAPAAVTGAGVVVLQTLARFRHPLAPGEIVSKSGLPRSTVYYWLSKLVRLGYVERVGKPRSVGVVYALTREGRRALVAARSAALGRVGHRFTGQARLKRRAGGRREGVARVLGRLRGVLRELRGLGLVLPLPLVPVLDGGVAGRLEAGTRSPYAPVRDYLRGLGVGMPRRRVKSVVCYAAGGWSHCDMPISPDVLSAVDSPENVLLLESCRLWHGGAVISAVLGALGYPPELVMLVFGAAAAGGHFVGGLDSYLRGERGEAV